ncbi:MAG TPA: glycosyltransferase family 61 protein [Marmoricola sp.]|nr:glycosyltransferase family 61 protein [Marmoricola sp.]
MSRLPSALQPAWPVLKRGHRLATRATGAVHRRTGFLTGERAGPARATVRAEATAALEPDRVRLHPGGPAVLLDRQVPPGSPKDHWVFRDRARFEVDRRYTLEIRDGVVVGDYSAHITPGGTLDYETSTYFGVDGWPEHPVFLRSRLPRAEHVEGTLLSLATRGSAANYYHFLLDVLPRWGVFRECLPELEPDVLWLNTGSRYMRELIGLLGLDRYPAISPGRHTTVRADRLLAPCIPNPHLMAPTWTTGWLKDNLPARDVAGRPRRIYLTRGSARNTRRLVNEAEVLEILEPLGFVVLDPGTLTVQEQIDHFTAAEVIVAPHGAALANLAFCGPGVRVLELFAPRYVNPCYWTIADNIPDARYRYLVCGTDARREGAPMQGVLTDITADPAAVRSALEELLS